MFAFLAISVSLLFLGGGALAGAVATWIDPDTPQDARTALRCSAPTPLGSLTSPCDVTAPPTTTMELVFSDEFNTPRNLSAAAADVRWTSEDFWCAGTHDMEIYESQQAVIVGGNLELTIAKAEAGHSVPTPADFVDGVPPPLYGYWNRKTNPDVIAPNETSFTSGMVTSWNKFCFTGGYIEAAITFPGDAKTPGFWPAFWLMGNLARVCRKWGTSGFWPYTYNGCGGEWWNDVGTSQPQNITKCEDDPGFDRTMWGFTAGQGRGAPEIDMVEFEVGWDNDVQSFFPTSLMTLQSWPPLPNGTTWTYQPGQIFPNISNGGLKTGLPDYAGDFTDPSDPLQSTRRAGNLFEDSISGFVRLDNNTFGSRPYKIGAHWEPGEFIRWYVDDNFVYEVNKEALRAQTAGGNTTQERLIPVEPMYIILNLAMSDGFTHNFIENFLLTGQLKFPASMLIDYVRVYQDANNVNHTMGCSPPDYPTEQYIACNPEKFIVEQEEQVLVPIQCLGEWSCRLDFNYEYVGGDLETVPNVTDIKLCCQACQAYAGCGAYSYNQSSRDCYLKTDVGTRTRREDMLSGVASPPVCTMEKNTLYTGGDLLAADGSGIATAPARSAIECCKACKNTLGCGAFSYVPGQVPACSMKTPSGWNRTTPTVDGTVSGQIGPNSTLGLCNLRADVALLGADLLGPDGSLISASASTPVQCCNICKNVAGCGAFTYTPGLNNTCSMNQGSGWLVSTASIPGTFSGVLADPGFADIAVDSRTCRAQANMTFNGGDLTAPNGNLLTAPSQSYGGCCDICKTVAGCGAYTFDVASGLCYLKHQQGWQSAAASNWVSGVLATSDGLLSTSNKAVVLFLAILVLLLGGRGG